MGTSYDPTTYLNQQATTAPFTRSVRRAAGFVQVGLPDCDLKAVGMIVWQGGN